MAQGLTIYFTVHANPLKNEDGETTYQVRQDTRGSLNTKGLQDDLRTHHTMPAVDLEPVVGMLARLLAEKMVDNAKVHLEGLGVFSLTLGLKPEVDEDGKKHKRVATSPEKITGNDVEITGVSFVPDKAFLETIRSKSPHFTQSGGKGRVGHSQDYTEEQGQGVPDGLVQREPVHQPPPFPLLHPCDEIQGRAMAPAALLGREPVPHRGRAHAEPVLLPQSRLLARIGIRLSSPSSKPGPAAAPADPGLILCL